MRRETRLAAHDPGNDGPGDTTTVLIRAGAPSPGAATEDGRAHYLAVVAGEHAGLRIELGRKPVVIGRVAPADLVIDDSQISRNHCRVSLVLEDVFVTDLSSSNGTMVDGQRIANNTFLPAGARLQIGGHVPEREVLSRQGAEAPKALGPDLDSAGGHRHSLIPAAPPVGPIPPEPVL